MSLPNIPRRLPGLIFLFGLMAAWSTVPVVGIAAEKPAGSFGFHRKIDARWLPDDARQWTGYAQSFVLADLSRAQPVTAVTREARRPGVWKVVPYETAGFAGNALSVYAHTEPPKVSVKLGREGTYAIYVGLITTSNGLGQATDNGLRVKLEREPVYRRMANNVKVVAPRRDQVQEQFFTVTDLSREDALEFAPLPNLPATVAYVRLVLVTAEEKQAWLRDLRERSTKTSVFTFDGGSWIWPYRPRSAEDLRANFRGMEGTDAGLWWFQIGADQVYYKSKVGTVRFDGAEDFPQDFRRDHAEAVRHLIDRGINPLVVAREAAREQGREFHVMLRPAAWAAAYPYEETFASRFYENHPEWRAVDYEGKRTFFMSYAVPEVRQHVIAVLRESVQLSDPDGVGFLFNRGMPMILWEPAFCELFAKEHGVDPRGVKQDDPRVLALRAKIMTGFFREVRTMLDEEGVKRNKRYQLSASTFGVKPGNDLFGLDVESWVGQGLVDNLGIAPNAHYVRQPGGGPVSLDVAYYHRVIRGTAVRLFPFVLASNPRNPQDLASLAGRYLAAGASGLGVWDPVVEQGHAEALPSISGGYQGNTIDLLSYFGHPELLKRWAVGGFPAVNHAPLKRFGENTFSVWFPNTGY